MSIMNPSMNKMIADLVHMPPPQLAQYAEQNKDNTMVFLAAKAASDIQKKQQAAGAAQQQQAAAPPVADQVVQQMAQGLPEESGIGALPAPNMRGYAGGGIVAFADGGEAVDQARARRDAIQQKLYTYGLRQRQQDPTGFQTAQEELRSAQEEMQAAEKNYASEMSASGINQLISNESPMGVSPNYQSGPHARPMQPQTASAAPGIPYTGTGVPSASAAALRSGASTQASQIERSGAARRSDTGAPPAAVSASTQPAQQPGETSDAMWKRISGAMPDARANLPKEIQEAEDIKTAQAGKVLASEKESASGLAALNDKQGARIIDREKRLADKSGNDVNMALIDAGLAMMQSRGQGLAGIAEGAGVGMKRYAEDAKATEAARQKIEEARDAYDNLKFNREDMSRKQILAAEGAIADARVATKTANVAEIARREGVNLKTAGHIYDNDAAKQQQTQNQQFQAKEAALNRDNALRAAGISAGASTAAKIDMLEKLGAADPKSALFKGYQLTMQEGQEPAMYKDYQTKALDPMQGEAFKKRFPTFELYKAGMSPSGGIQSSGGAAAPIRER
jgi:hypothetical protein